MAFGRLEKPMGHRPMSDINVTPLVDVMLVLLVIFILAAPLLSSQLDLELPRTPEPVVEKVKKTEVFVSLSIDAQGQMYWDDSAVDEPGLRTRLSQAAKADPATELRLRADAAVPYGQVVRLIALAQAAGLSHIGFLADPETGEPQPLVPRKP
ncbi:MAG: biopolymer transporter ExbD [Burkholderiaceae bacterium]